jgi:endoglucanase
VQTAGTFHITVPGVGASYPFQIQENVHWPVALAALKGFYFIRSDMPLDAQFAGIWQRPAGHPDTVVYIHPSAADAQRPAGTIISSPGGWYDAGDYNKYIVNSGITMGTLLSAYEDFKKYFDTLHTAIPESGDALPDLLNEVVYNLRWMLTMQDPNDGGVYHKCTNATFDGMVMPGVTKLPRYAVQKSTAATLDFAAVAAQASRILILFEKQAPGLGDSCLKAAEQAWQWAVQHPGVAYDQNELNKNYDPYVSTGAYGDRQLRDEWLWAAAEMFIITKKKRYYDTVVQHMKDSVGLPSWPDVGRLGYDSLLRFNNLPAYTKQDAALMKRRVLRLAEAYQNAVPSSAFATVMGQSPKDFIWGSSAVAANQGILLINAYRLSGNEKYLEGALSNLDYLMGRNATGYCFLTGTGSKSPMHPHHRPSMADGVATPVLWLLSGGPNPGRQDSCRYEFTEPETAFSDTDCSYASNEIAINWNAPLVYLAHAVEVLAPKFSKKSKAGMQ